jgi:hypothetical protein
MTVIAAKNWFTRRLLLVVLVALIDLLAGDPRYRSVSVGGGGQLHIVPDPGKEILPGRGPGQVSFGQPVISPDRRTVGWLAMYPDPSAADNE